MRGFFTKVTKGYPTSGGGGGSSPTWYQNLTSGQWGTIPDTHLTAHAKFETDDTFPPYSGSGLSNLGNWHIMDAFDGAALIEGSGYIYEGSTQYSGEALYLKGGGHQIGATATFFIPLLYDTSAGTTKVKKVHDSQFNGGAYIYAVSGDAMTAGYPAASQTYDSLCYIAASNKIYQMGQTFCHDISNGPLGVAQSLSINCSQASPDTNNPYSLLANPPFADVTATAFESNRGTAGTIWIQAAGAASFCSYDVNADTYSSVLSLSYPVASQATMAVDTNRGILCMVGQSPLGSGNFKIGMLDCSNPSGDWYGYSPYNGAAPTGMMIANSGSTPTMNHANGNTDDPTIVWNPDQDCFTVWWGGKTLHHLRPPSSSPYKNGNNWTWDPVTPSSGSTPNSAAVDTTSGSTYNQGVYGRFQYVHNSNIRGYLLLHGVSEDIYFYKA